MSQHEKVDYLEFPTKNIEASKTFFTRVFDWKFTDYGPEYAAFFKSEVGIDGGFFSADLTVSARQGSALVVFYSEDLEQTITKIETAGGTISQSIFSFPGGRRFHFTDPSNNEFAVWSDETGSDRGE